jgi:DNA-directed RNA polymerase specialized sigma24 family protein
VLEALARAWEHSDRGDSIESLTARVTTVAMNLVRSGLRRLRVERRNRERTVAPARRAPEAGIDLERGLRDLSLRQSSPRTRLESCTSALTTRALFAGIDGASRGPSPTFP